MSLGFIILRHVNDVNTNFYWIECYQCIRKYYPTNPILIIDDNSNYDFITTIFMKNVTVINSEYKGRGELLPYIYYLRYPISEKVVFVHDSIFFQRYVDFIVENVPLFSFPTMIEDSDIELKLLNALTNCNTLIDNYHEMKWNGSFGAMSIITLSFLKMLENKYTLSNLIDHVTCRIDRQCLERIIGIILTVETNLSSNSSVFGDILTYCQWGITYSMYLKDKDTKKLYMFIKTLPIAKVWTGR